MTARKTTALRYKEELDRQVLQSPFKLKRDDLMNTEEANFNRHLISQARLYKY